MCADVTTNNTTVCLYWWLAGGALDRPNQTQTWTALDMQRNGKFLALDKILIRKKKPLIDHYQPFQN